MKQFEINVTGYVNPHSETYTIESKNRRQAKEQAVGAFKNSFGEYYDRLRVCTLREIKEPK